MGDRESIFARWDGFRSLRDLLALRAEGKPKSYHPKERGSTLI